MPTLDIGVEFSKNPEGRFYTDGDASGEHFRENYLLPRLRGLQNGEVLEVVIDSDVDGYGSSFLTEGFAGVVKYGYMTASELQNKLRIRFSNKDFGFFARKIDKYISESQYRAQTYIPTPRP